MTKRRRPSKQPEVGERNWVAALELGLGDIQTIVERMDKLLAKEQPPNVAALLGEIRGLAQSAANELAPLLYYRETERESDIADLAQRVERLVGLLEDSTGKVTSINDRRKSGNG